MLRSNSDNENKNFVVNSLETFRILIVAYSVKTLNKSLSGYRSTTMSLKLCALICPLQTLALQKLHRICLQGDIKISVNIIAQ